MGDEYPRKPILVVDDEISWVGTIRAALKILANITNVESCTDSQNVPALLAVNDYSLVLLDLTMPIVSGEELLDLISEKYPELPVIVISGANQVATAVNCIKKGAEDFFMKSDDLERIINSIKKTLRERALRNEHFQLSENFSAGPGQPHPVFADIITQDSAMLRIFTYLEAIASSHEPVLIQGESGTGKELIAKALHQLCCEEKPFVAVNVAGLDDMLFSDTLFGHCSGAYTGADRKRSGMIEEAAGGILFLDEIGELSQLSQIKLLRLLQSGEYYPLGSDVPMRCSARVAAATNLNLDEKEAQGVFRRDLLFRLKTHRIQLPPLRKRRDDISLLVNHFVAEAANRMGKKKPAENPDLLPILQTYSFPGNHRELRAMVFDAVSLHQEGPLAITRFAETMARQRQAAVPPASEYHGESVPEFLFPDKLPTLKEMTDLLINEALRRSAGNQSHAAKFLGISQQALNKRLKGKS